MLSTWIQACLSVVAPSPVSERALTPVEEIDAMLMHYGELPTLRGVNRFFGYSFPCRSFRYFRQVFADVIQCIDQSETPRVMKIQTVKHDNVYYSEYFKKHGNVYFQPEEARAIVFKLLKELRLVYSESQHQDSLYYQARISMLLEYTHEILEVLTHEGI